MVDIFPYLFLLVILGIIFLYIKENSLTLLEVVFGLIVGLPVSILFAAGMVPRGKEIIVDILTGATVF